MIGRFLGAYAAWQNLKDIGDPFDVDLDDLDQAAAEEDRRG